MTTPTTTTTVLPGLGQFQGKIIEHIDLDKHQECLIIRFTDRSFWVILAQHWNCAGARLLQKWHVEDEKPPTAKR